MCEEYMSIRFRTPYNYDMSKVSRETGLVCVGESLAVQASKDECDINTLVRRFGLTGQLPVGLKAPSYGDFTGVNDYQSAIHAVQAAEAAFMEMPAEVRSRFRNSPQAFLEFVEDDRNRAEAEKLGLVFNQKSVGVMDSARAESVSPADSPRSGKES